VRQGVENTCGGNAHLTRNDTENAARVSTAQQPSLEEKRAEIMRQMKYTILVMLVIAAGAIAICLLDWKRESRSLSADAVNTAEQLAELLSFYPLHEMDGGTRSLLAKTLVEQSGMGVAYLNVIDEGGDSLLHLGSDMLQITPDTTGTLTTMTTLRRRQFPAPDGDGKIVEYIKPFDHSGRKGIVGLGLRLTPTPLLSAARTSSAATVVFLMIAAIVVGYYTMVLAIRRSTTTLDFTGSNTSGRPPRTARGSENVLRVVEEMNERLAGISGELHETSQRNAKLSSSLGVARFEAQQAYRILDGLDSGLLVLDHQGRISRVNQTMLELLACDRGTATGKPYAEAIQHQGLVALLDEYGESGGTQSSVIETQFSDTAPDRHFRLSCRPLWDATGDTIGTVVTAEDFTRVKLVRKTQDDFLGEVVHELLTPLTSLKTYSELLVNGDVREEEMQREFYNTINSETDRLTDLVKNLLNVSKMETGALTIERGLVKTDWLLDQCLPSIEATATGKRIAIEKHLPDTFPTIMGDKALLQVVLVNILGNAVKYTPEDGSIRVSLLHKGKEAWFEVADTGCGIPEEDVPRVFEKFYRGEASSVRDQVGSGIGLSTAMQIVKLHGGSIELESTPGEGSCFTVRIPTEEYTLEKR
jgi:signal transduction histidine kinase